MSSKNFIKFFIYITFCIFVLHFVFSILVDPYNIWHNYKIKNFNHDKPKAFFQAYLNKDFNINYLKPDTVFIGSSTVLLGFNPENLQTNQNNQIYNSGVDSGSPKIAYYILKNHLEKPNNVSRVLLGLDFYFFNNDLEDKKHFKTNIEIYKNKIVLLYSRSHLYDSLYTIYHNLNNSENLLVINNYGYLDSKGVEEMSLSRFKNTENIFRNSINDYIKNSKIFFKNNYKFELSDKNINYVKKIIDLCDSNSIQLDIFFVPVHALLLDTLITMGLEKEMLNWKKSILDMHHVHDFLNFSELNSEPISNNMTSFLDVEHFHSQLGVKIFESMENYIPNSSVNTKIEFNYLNREKWKKNDIIGHNILNQIKLK